MMLIDKIAGDTYAQFGLLGLIVLLFGAIIVYIIWDRWQDTKKDREVESKKKNGSYVSWEAMNEKVNSLEGQLNREGEHLFNQTKTLFEKFDKLEDKMDKRFETLDQKIDSKFDTLTKILLENK